MITTAEEYYSQLATIQQSNGIPEIAVLMPKEEQIFEIDLNSRTIQSPEFLSVTTDHTAETIYFKVNRYFDNIDLSTMVAVVQYIIPDELTGMPKDEGYLYVVPFYDVQTYGGAEYANNPYIVFPWCISGSATKNAGTIKYSIRFFKIDDSGSYFLYNLNTLPTTSQILYGMDISKSETFDFATTDNGIDYVLEAIQDIKNILNDDESGLSLRWIDV